MNIFEIFGKIGIKNNEANDKLDQTNDKASKVAKEMQQKFETVGQGFTKVGQGITKVGTVMTGTLTTGIIGLGAAGLKYNMEMENFQMNLTTLLGSSDKATKLLNDLQEMAATTPFETTDLISATETMIGFGISAKDSQKYLSMIGDIAMGDANKLSGLSLAFSQVQSTGKLTGQDLLQMINQGFNPLKYISEQTGKSMATLKEEMADGKITAEMVGDAFEYATSKGQPFYKGMENGSKTVSGRISTLKDNFQILIGKLTEGLLPVFEKVVDKLTAITEKFTNMSPEQQDQILKWAGIVAAIGPVLMILGKLTSGLGTVFNIVGKVKGMGGLAGLTAKFSTLMPVIGSVLGPIAAVVGVLVLLVGALGGPKEALEKLKQAFQWCKDVIGEFLEKINFSETLNTIKTAFAGLWEKLKGLGDLFKVVGAVVGATLVPAIGVLAGLFNGVMNAIGPLIDAIGGIIDILAGVGSFIVGVFTGDIGKMSDGLTTVKDGVLGVFSGLWEAVKGLLGGFLEGIWNFFTTLADKIGLTDFLVKVKGKVSDWWNNFVSGIKSGWSNICAFFSTIANWINDNVIQPVINFFKGLWNGIKEVWDGICFAIDVAIKLIASIFNAAFQIITLPFQFIWQNCKDVILAVWDWISNKISTAINFISTIISTVFNAVKTFISTVWDGIKTVISTVVDFIKTRISNTFNAIKTVVSTIFNAIKTVISTVWNGIKTTISTVVEAIKTVISNVFNAIKSFVSTVWEGIKTVIINPIKNAYNTVKTTVGNIKDKVINTFNTVKTKVTTVFNGIRDAIKKPIEKARDLVKGAIDKIKGFFNFKFEWPKLKMPKFGISPEGWKIGDLTKGVIPKLSITWNKEGAIFQKPTIFDTDNGLQGVGEAGPEAIAPISKLQDYVRFAVETSNVGLEDKLNTLVDLLTNYLPMLSSRQLCLDSGVLVGALVDPMDKALAEKTEARKRGR